MEGFLLIDKGSGLTSFDVIRKLRRIFKEKKIGHAGTLDPLATGLLFVALGRATKSLKYFVGLDKEYEVIAKFGMISETYDAEGPLKVVGTCAEFSKKKLEKVIKENFTGETTQIPPKYSALKIGGKRAADLVRKGISVEMKPRRVNINGFEITDFSLPEVSFKIQCGSGTYVRSLIHDLGQKLGCGAYVTDLKRTKIGDFNVSDRRVLFVGRNFDFNEDIKNYLIPVELLSELCKNRV